MKNIVHLSIVILTIAGATSCSNAGKDTNKKATAQQKTAYNLMALQSRHIKSTVQQPGVLQPFEFVQIFPKVNGFIKEVYVDRGSEVKKGAVLLKLEAPEVEENVSAAQLRYAQAHATYLISKDRYLRLLETSKTPGTVSQYDLLAARSKMMADSATAQGEYAQYQAQRDLESYLTVTAPFDGVITERNVHPGALVGPGTSNKPMLILQQQSKLRLVVHVPEQYSTQIDKNGLVHFQVNALPGQTFTGKIARASGALNESFRSETMEIDVLNPNNVFKPGMYAEVTIPIAGNTDAFIVPRSAIVTTTERKYVIVVNSDKAQWIDVTEGDQANDSTEVFGNLKTGDHIVTNGSYQIRDGEAIASR